MQNKFPWANIKVDTPLLHAYLNISSIPYIEKWKRKYCYTLLIHANHSHLFKLADLELCAVGPTNIYKSKSATFHKSGVNEVTSKKVACK